MRNPYPSANLARKQVHISLLRLDPCEELHGLLLRHQDKVLLEELERVALGEPPLLRLCLVLDGFEALLSTVSAFSG